MSKKMNENRRTMQDKSSGALLKNELLMNERIMLILEKQKKMDEIQELKEKEKIKEQFKQMEENKKKNRKNKGDFGQKRGNTKIKN